MNIVQTSLGVAALAAILGSTPFAQCNGSKHDDSSATKVAAWLDVEKKDIVDTAVEAGNFTTLAAALGAADLVGALKGEGPFTVFAPTDEAFAKLGDATLKDLLKPENKAKLASILLFHVVPGDFDAAKVTKASTLDSLNGQRIDVTKSEKGLHIDGASLVATDIACSNGRIHVIDTVIVPTADTIVSTAKAAGSFNTLLDLVTRAGLAETLMGDGPFTVFAPTDDAFAKLDAATLKALGQPENVEALKSILTYHVVGARVFADQAVALKRAKTLQGGEVTITTKGKEVMINGAKVAAADLDLANGVIHVIDQVLLPADLQLGTPKFGVYLEAPSRELADYLGIDPHASQMISDTTARGGARRAGLEARDIIVAVDGHPATHANLDRVKDGCRSGQTVEVAVLRRGQPMTFHVPVFRTL